MNLYLEMKTSFLFLFFFVVVEIANIIYKCGCMYKLR